MPQEPVRTAAHGWLGGDDDHPHVPPPPEAPDRPPAQRLRSERRAGERKTRGPRKRAAEEEDFGSAAGKEERVHHRHPAEVRGPALAASAGERDPGVAAGEKQLREALGGEAGEKGQVPAYHSSSTSSEQNPGPIASRRPRSPGRASPEASRSERTKSTEAEERFPADCSESQLRCISARGSSSASSNASSTFGPPV